MTEDVAAEQVTLAEFVQMAIDAHMLDVHVSLPARVESFDASKQTVEVTIMVNRMVPDGATPPNWVSEKMPRLKDVPVAFLRGGGFFMSLPLQQGDPGMLIFAERPLGAWRSTGAQGDPGDLGMHTVDGAYFVPAVAPDKSKLSNADANNMVIGSDSAHAARLVLKGSGEIDAGANATNFVAMAEKVLTELQNIATALGTHTHGGVTTGTGTSGPPATPPYTAPASVASTNLKAED